MHLLKNIFISALATVSVACGSSNKANADNTAADDVAPVSAPTFNADSAYSYVKAQTDMGPRTPGSQANKQCQQWMVAKLHAAGADTVIEQCATVTDHTGTRLPINNVLGRFNTKASKRMLLLAHYDTRPWADEDADATKHNTPIDGANDGASGVAVLLELARQIGNKAPSIGVDILMVDAEDSGISAPDGASEQEQADTELTWCLGTQYFAQHLPYNSANAPMAAILLDMVGGKDAVFKYEYFSYESAQSLCEAVWQTADKAGFGSRFVKSIGGAVTDDHLHLIAAGIPTIDIIEIGHPQTGSFNPTWHTTADNISNIDTATLKAVGQTVINYIYSL
jgi:Zn-dependent M28 family amino/carboxypeptidase